MLDSQIQRERQHAVDDILGRYREWYLPHAMLVPRARFGLYAIAKGLLSPGDRILISPITCSTVINALLAARVTPVFVDIELATGNIDVSRLCDAELSNSRAIVTTNLYGNPDAVEDLKSIAASHNLLLIEDCAHVLQTCVSSREIGGIGDISVFSFKKYFDELGGVVCVRDEAVATKLRATIAAETTTPTAREERMRFCQFQLEKAAGSSIVRGLSSLHRRLRTIGIRRENRIHASMVGASHPAFTSSLPTTATLLRVADRLRRRQELIQARCAAARQLIANCPLPVKRSSSATQVVYLAVPFYSPNRDTIVTRLASRHIPTYFRYTPPMSKVFRNCSRLAHGFDEDRLEHWCRNILPVHPDFGLQFLQVLGQIPSRGDAPFGGAAPGQTCSRRVVIEVAIHVFSRFLVARPTKFEDLDGQ